MGSFETSLEHLKNHVEYPASREEVVAACNSMSDVPTDDRDWFVNHLPAGNYNNADEVLSAILEKI